MVRRILARVHEPLAVRLRDVLERPEVLVVALTFAGEIRVQGVVEVVRPLRVQTQPAVVAGRGDTPVVLIGLGDQQELPVVRIRGLRQLLQERPGGLVHDPVDGVEPQRIDMELARPAQRVLHEAPSHVVRARPVEVDRLAPRRAIPDGEVRPVVGENVPLRAEVVVHDVEHHREASRMASVDEPLVPLRAAVRVVHGEGEHAVVSPVPRTRELRDRHRLDRGHPQVDKILEVGDDRVERPFAREGPDVQLVDHVVGGRDRPPSAVRPLERGGVEHRGRAVHALRLPPRRRVRQLAAVEREPVLGPRSDAVHHRVPVSAASFLQLDAPLSQDDVDPFRERRPHEELCVPVAEIRSAELRSQRVRPTSVRRVSGTGTPVGAA